MMKIQKKERDGHSRRTSSLGDCDSHTDNSWVGMRWMALGGHGVGGDAGDYGALSREN